jgi:pimeloyl-ACP methyl ester carboxylesterase
MPRTFFTIISLEKVEQIKCPLLVIHGEADNVTPIEQAREIHASCLQPVKPLFLSNVGHWGIELTPELLNRIREFIKNEVN